MATALKLTDPRIERGLGVAVAAVSAAAAIWTGVVLYELGAARSDVSSKSGRLETVKSQKDTADINFRIHRRTAGAYGDVPVETPVRETSELAYSINSVIQHFGGRLITLRFGAKSDDSGKSGGPDHATETGIFDCTIEGTFPALMHIVDSISSTSSNVKIMTTDLSRAQMDPKTGESIVSMHLLGRLDQ